MNKPLAAASGALLAVAAIASAGMAFADDMPPMPPPVSEPAAVDGAAPVEPDQADQAAAATPVGATQASSMGASIGSSMAMMAPMMAIYVPLMGLPMAMQALPGLAQASAQANGDAGSAAATDLFNLDSPTDVPMPAGLDNLDLTPVLDPDLVTGAAADTAGMAGDAGADIAGETAGIAAATGAEVAGSGVATGGDATCFGLSFVGFC